MAPAPFVCPWCTFVSGAVPIWHRGFIPVTEVHMTATRPQDQKKGDVGFDPESPDLEDPQVDPTEPAKTPEKESPKGDYPPYDQPEK